MLNRRVLRIKAMQALYSYFLTKESLKEMLRDQLVLKYKIDPALHDFSEKAIFEAKQKQISAIYEDLFETGASEKSSSLDESIIQDIHASIDHYKELILNEQRSIKAGMIKEARGIEHTYYKLLLYPSELAFLEKQEKEKINKAYIKKDQNWRYNFIKNPIIEQLSRHPDLIRKSKESQQNWVGETDVLKQWYKDIIKKDETIIQYQSLTNPNDDQHYEIFVYLFKKIIFKNDTIENYLVNKDLYWNENRPILKSMIIKTIKTYDKESLEKFELKPISYNEAEDFEFFEKLFVETLNNEHELNKIIENKSKNWDTSRIANIDMVILKLALTEMTKFPSIPVKVTINEFIEISKNYSTPKSKQFINGILDVLANQLTSEGFIKKSGRGLIDNK